MRNNWRIHAVLLSALVGACAIGLSTGAVHLSWQEIFSPGVGRMRLARVLLSVVVGAGLSVAGVIFQALLRNPLAEPYVLGASSGAGLAAALAILLGLSASALGAWALPITAFAGAMATVVLVYTLARSARAGGAMSIFSLLLSGVVVGSVLGSLLMFLVSVAPPERVHNIMWWMLGNLQVFDWALLRAVAALVCCGLIVTMLLGRDLNVIAMGEESAAHLGLNPERSKLVLFALGSLITGAVVSAAGLIAFVGLIVPHSVRLALGPDHRRLVPASAIAGATFVVLADALGRTVLAPVEIPVGVVTSVLGGPFFLLLLKRRGRA